MNKYAVLASTALIVTLAATVPAFAALTSPRNDLPVYPGAKKLSAQMRAPMKSCGRAMIATVYSVNAPSASVERWYLSKIPGATSVKVFSQSAEGTTGALILVRGGGEGVGISRWQSGAAPSNEAMIGLTAYDPAFSDADVALMAAATKVDSAARAKLKRRCSANAE